MNSSNELRPTIDCSPNGPFIVKDLNKLQNSKGQNIDNKPVIALCRCGKSANKPFCDGTHTKVNFSDTKEADEGKNKRKNYVGKEISIRDNRGICSHSGFCTDQLSSVFKLKEEPWIDPNGEKAEKIIEIIKKCPSGALSYSLGSTEHRDQNREEGIAVSKDGPYFIVGNIDLKGIEWGEGASKEHYTLCRCGSSKNKPFCDGTHWYIKFKDEKN